MSTANGLTQQVCGRRYIIRGWTDRLTATDAVAKEDGAARDYSGTSRGPTRTLTNKTAGGDDFDDDERQYEGDGIVGDDEI